MRNYKLYFVYVFLVRIEKMLSDWFESLSITGLNLITFICQEID